MTICTWFYQYFIVVLQGHVNSCANKDIVTWGKPEDQRGLL